MLIATQYCTRQYMYIYVYAHIHTHSLSLSPSPSLQAAALCFINTVVQTAHGPNSKVFHQHEFLEAGFSPEEVEKSLHGRQDERVLHELREWRKNFIDIQQYMDDLAMARGRARNLKEEVCMCEGWGGLGLTLYV